MRKYFSRRLLALSEGEIAALTTSMRQIGVGAPGGAEALAIFHQLLWDEWMTGSLSGPLGSGMIEWQAVREAASRFLTKHTAAAAWKHRNVSFFEQEGLSPMPKDRGAEQGDVDGPLECSLALGMEAAQARGSIAARQAVGTLPWIGVTDSAEGTATPSGTRCQIAQESANYQLGGPEKLTGAHDPRHALQRNGGLADQWYMDDGDIMCHPILVLLFLQDFDVANARVGAERNPLKTEAIYFVDDLDASPPEWKIGDGRSLAKTSAVTDSSFTLGVAVGSRQFIADQLLSKANVIRAMHGRVQLCQDPQTEFSLLRECLGVSRINHILWTEDSMTQATLSAGQSGIGFKRARDIAAPAHLGALIAAKPRTRVMIRDAVLAGLLPEQLLETRLSEVMETATSTYLSALDNDEQATARLFIQKAAQAADESWQHTVSCLRAARPRSRWPDHCVLGTSRLRLSGGRQR